MHIAKHKSNRFSFPWSHIQPDDQNHRASGLQEEDLPGPGVVLQCGTNGDGSVLQPQFPFTVMMWIKYYCMNLGDVTQSAHCDTPHSWTPQDTNTRFCNRNR